jgi:hypothetical protein
MVDPAPPISAPAGHTPADAEQTPYAMRTNANSCQPQSRNIFPALSNAQVIPSRWITSSNPDKANFSRARIRSHFPDLQNCFPFKDNRAANGPNSPMAWFLRACVHAHGETFPPHDRPSWGTFGLPGARHGPRWTHSTRDHVVRSWTSRLTRWSPQGMRSRPGPPASLLPCFFGGASPPGAALRCRASPRTARPPFRGQSSPLVLWGGRAGPGGPRRPAGPGGVPRRPAPLLLSSCSRTGHAAEVAALPTNQTAATADSAFRGNRGRLRSLQILDLRAGKNSYRAPSPRHPSPRSPYPGTPEADRRGGRCSCRSRSAAAAGLPRHRRRAGGGTLAAIHPPG